MRGIAAQWKHSEGQEVRCLDQFRPDRVAGVGRVRGIIRLNPGIIEFDKARILNAMRLGFGYRENDPLADVFLGEKANLDVFTVRNRNPARLASFGVASAMTRSMQVL